MLKVYTSKQIRHDYSTVNRMKNEGRNERRKPKNIRDLPLLLLPFLGYKNEKTIKLQKTRNNGLKFCKTILLVKILRK